MPPAMPWGHRENARLKCGAASMRAPGICLCLLLFVSCMAAAEDPYVSTGYVALPAEAEIGAVSGVAVDAQDRLYVLHRGEPPLLAFDEQGKFIRGWGKRMFKVPHGLRVDREGNIWTTDNGNHVLRKFSREGKLLRIL